MAKDRAFKVFLALPYYDVIDNLAKMVDAFQTDDEITKAVSRYVMLLYARRQARRQGRNLQDDKHWRSKLRWRLYSKHQKETESLPLTPSALNRHIQRSIFVTGLWKLSAKQFRPQLPRLQEVRSMDGRSIKTGLVLSGLTNCWLLSTVLRWSAAVARS